MEKRIVKNWSLDEEEKLLKLKQEGKSLKQISKILNRGYESVKLKHKRLKQRIDIDTYNQPHRDEKYKANDDFYREFDKINSILDVYCGVNQYWKNHTLARVVSNDFNKEIDCDYNMDALKLLCKLYLEEKRFDIVDLDPFGSAYECFDLAIKLAHKGIIITLGEINHKHWKRLDFVRKRYDINNLDDFTLDNLINKIKLIGLQNSKELEPVIIYEQNNIARVYFKIYDYKETSQWEMGNENE